MPTTSLSVARQRCARPAKLVSNVSSYSPRSMRAIAGISESMNEQSAMPSACFAVSPGDAQHSKISVPHCGASM